MSIYGILNRNMLNDVNIIMLFLNYFFKYAKFKNYFLNYFFKK